MRNLFHRQHRPDRALRFALAAFIPRRGVAMLLVIISVMTATILTMSYLSSRDNSMAISENAIATSAARWVALSGIDLALAALQTDSDWRAFASGGVLLDSYPFLGGELTVYVTDVDTGNPPTTETVLVELAAVVTGSSGMEQRAHAVAAVAIPTEGVLQLDLADFAIFADEAVRVNSGGLVARWETSPRTRLGLPIPIGVRATLAGSIQIGGGSNVIDAKVHYKEGGHPNLVDSSQVMRVVEMKDAIPLPAAPPSNVEHPGSGNGHMNVGSNVILVDQLTWDQITVQAGRLVQIPNDPTVVIGGDLTLLPNSRIRIEGNTTLVVFGNVDLQQDSYIEVVPGATLRMHVEGNLELVKAYIGRERSNKSIRDRSGNATWMDPNRIQLLGFGDSPALWEIDDTSVVKASIYAPQAEVIVEGLSAVYGRIAARRVRVRDSSSLFFDHTLDHFAGYANSKSLLFDSDGYIFSVFKDMSTVDTSQLSDVADASGLQFRVFARSIGTAGSFYDMDSVSVGDPTPRPIAVDYQLLSVGMEPRDWELAGP